MKSGRNWGRLGMKYELSELVDIIGGGTPKTSVSEYWNGNIPWISVKDFNNDNRYVYETEKSITQAGLDHSSTKVLSRDDIIISARGTVGELAMISKPMAFNQSCYGIRAKKSINNTFLYYLLKNSINKLKLITHGSVFDTITRDTFSQIEIDLPSLEIQKQIASILSALDDKIELNNRINENLESQAQALFKSWFLDYDPWDGFVPDSWNDGKLGDFAEIKRGGSPRPIQEYLSDSGLRWLKISDVTSLQTPFIIDIKDHIIEAGLRKTVFLKAGSLVLSNSATPGVPKILDVDSCIHDGWLYFPESKFSKEYLYLYFKYIRQQLVNLSNGSVFNNLKTDILKGYPTILPDKDTLRRFDDIVVPMFLQMQNLTRESHKLADMRNALLPKLMNGEIDVSEVKI